MTDTAVLYLRQSTYREESISLEIQEAAGREYAKQRGYTVTAVESDPGISGRTWNRPGVMRTVKAIEDGTAKVVVVWKWSRLSRSRLDWAIAVDKVEALGGRIESATEPVDTSTSTGRLARGMLAEFAAFESERIGDVWKETMQRRRVQGLPATGGQRFGYTLEDTTYTSDPVTGPILAEMYQRHNRGEGFTRIARWLNSQSIPTIRGGEWTHTKVMQTLDAGFGAGKIIQRSRDRKQVQYHDGVHEPVIGAEEWDEYRADRKKGPRKAARSFEPASLLISMIRCGDCGAAMHANAKNGTPIYRCSAASRGESVKWVAIQKNVVEGYVRDWVFQYATDLDARTAELRKTEKRHVDTAATRRALEAKIKKIDQRLAKLTIKWLDMDGMDATYQATVAALEAERSATLDRMPPEPVTAVEQHAKTRDVALHLTETWDQLTVQEARAALLPLIRSVTVYPAPKLGVADPSLRITITPTWD